MEENNISHLDDNIMNKDFPKSSKPFSVVCTNLAALIDGKHMQIHK